MIMGRVDNIKGAFNPVKITSIVHSCSHTGSVVLVKFVNPVLILSIVLAV